MITPGQGEFENSMNVFTRTFYVLSDSGNEHFCDFAKILQGFFFKERK